MKKIKLILFVTALLSNVVAFSQTTYIRTVVHVMYTTPLEDISDATVLNYINEVNKGYAKLTPAKFTRVPDIFGSDWANTDIQLCIANLDPNNNPTNGITHTQINNPFQISQNPNTPNNPVWDPNVYLNIYLTPVYPEIGFPNFIIGGWASTPTNPQMGATFNYVLVASNSIAFKPELLSHEIGHVFGLEHVDNDNLSDTPKGIEIITPNIGYSTTCDIQLQTQNTTNLAQDGNHWGGINPPDMVENFMGLTFCCQFMFTNNQASFMQSYIGTHLSSWVIPNCSTTTGLSTSEIEQIGVFLFPNPSNSTITITDSEKSGIFNIEIIDIHGKKYDLEKKQSYNHPIDISHFSTGVYFARIIDAESNTVNYLRFMKN